MKRGSRPLRWLVPLLPVVWFGVAPVSGSRPEGHPVSLGMFLPSRGPEARLGEEVLRGARIAVDAINREGGINGRMLRLVTASSDLLWEGSSRELVRLIYDEKVAAVIGALDGRTAHVAEQVIARARGQAVFVTPWASEASLTRIGIPWFFRLVPDDRIQAETLAREIFTIRRFRRVAVWEEEGFDSPAAAEAFLRIAPAGSVERFTAGRESSRERLVEKISRGGIDALVLLASPPASADLLRRVQPAAGQVEVFGPLSLAVPGFLDRAGGAADGVHLLVPAPPDRNLPALERFIREFRKIHEEPPTPPALYGHDAISVIAAAIREAGTETGGELSGVLAASAIEGLTGPVRFDRRRGRDLEPSFTVVRDGRLAGPESDS